ncbi:general secretion pathway protein GspF [Salmonella enterica subsp. enterica serovar Infantis]|nr:general secretion pathway protein GspF [Salmonella enterica subsp. enterica serovar Infantis]
MPLCHWMRTGYSSDCRRPPVKNTEDILQALNIFLTGILPGLKNGNRWMARKTFSMAERRELYEGLAFLLDNNKTLETALSDMLAVTTDFGKKRETGTAMCLQDCLSALRDGQSLDIGLDGWVPPQEIAIISAGVSDGRLSDALRRATTIVENLGNLKSECFSTLTYPFFLLGTMLLMMYMTGTKFVPQLARVTDRASWTGALWWMAAISDFVINNAVPLGVAIMALVCWMVWSLPNLTGRARPVLDNLMPWSVYRDFQGISFLLNLAALMRANFRLLETLNVLSRHASPWLLERLDATRAEVNSGAHLGQALKNTGFNFPSAECVNRLVLLTGGDNAELIIDSFAMQWLASTRRAVKARISRISAISFLLVGGWLFLLLMASQQINTLAIR